MFKSVLQIALVSGGLVLFVGCSSGSGDGNSATPPTAPDTSNASDATNAADAIKAANANNAADATKAASTIADAVTPTNTPPISEPVKQVQNAAKSTGDVAMKAIEEFIASANIDTGNATWRTNLRRPPEATFAPDTTYYWNMETSHGKIKIKLLSDVAPMHVTSTIYLTLLGYYDGLVFHRVITEFMAQGGCPLGNGTGGPGYEYAGEFDASVRHDRPGLLSMANRGPNTDGSQFFLTFVPTPHLNRKHTIFGEVTEGMETVKALEARGSPGGNTTERLVMGKCTITTE